MPTRYASFNDSKEVVLQDDELLLPFPAGLFELHKVPELIDLERQMVEGSTASDDVNIYGIPLQ